LISIDSLRADHLSCYGYGRETSPNLDRLAREGVLFETVIAESSWTLPAHISMLTGLSSAVHGVELDHMSLPGAVPTLAARLRQAGYRTKGIYSGPYLHPVFGFSNGFDEYEGVFGENGALVRGIEAATSDFDRRRAILEANRSAHRTVTSPAVTDKAIEYIGRPAGEPFFLFLHYFDVHYDYIPLESVWRRFDPDYDGTLTGDGFVKNPRIHPRMDSKDLAHLKALYDGEIFFTDQHVGRLLDALEERGLAGRTLVVVTSDHGEEFFEHGRKGHRRTLHDEVLRVPLILRLPGGIPAGIRVDGLARHVDLAPTILSLLGIDLEAPVSGTALEASARGAHRPEPNPAVSRLDFADGDNRWISARTKEHKYLLNVRSGRRREIFYDLTRDPGEQQPIVTSSGENGLEALNRLREALATVESRERSLREIYGGSRGVNIEVPEDVREQLRSLGYVP
jgi:arylsulfatase A-like enzyme